jgi:hypothetical protein
MTTDEIPCSLCGRRGDIHEITEQQWGAIHQFIGGQREWNRVYLIGDDGPDAIFFSPETKDTPLYCHACFQNTVCSSKLFGQLILLSDEEIVAPHLFQGQVGRYGSSREVFQMGHGDDFNSVIDIIKFPCLLKKDVPTMKMLFARYCVFI